MIKIDLHLPDGRKITAQVRNRQYRKLTVKIEKMGFWDKVKLLFRKDK